MDSKTAYDATKFRILMLHGEIITDILFLKDSLILLTRVSLTGFGSNRTEFRAKSSRISKRIHELVTPAIIAEFPGGIEFLYPNAPITLEPPLGFGTDITEQKGKWSVHDAIHGEDSDSTAMAWWYGRDNVSRYRGIENSLSFVARYIHGRPIHGIIGFSQGACLSGMICSLLECINDPQKAAAIRLQNLPVDDYLRLPCQEPLRFFIGIGGYRGTLQYYGSLYSSLIKTPSCHALASMDFVVEPFQTMNLAGCFSSPELVHFYGCHFVPRDRASVEALAHFALRNSRETSPSSRFPSVVRAWSESDGDESRSSTWGPDQSLRILPVWRELRKPKVIRGRVIRLPISRRPISAST
ncbi:hypothetical protein CNMCM6805_002017 [Aspergillus fumigatiaffinis]|jgi:hypothetical protein|uniref:Serine hydrolase domain-containing protein n=1 Tax=Aspergillus fumigatiaffinis TaxID=340414 RepID=A0A8H4MDM1_9EURO|nr:hypothetical protein CNMCM5878_007563 [Aspergillus fumigatiaffinis]KAF4242909.1 hypothetical protein CNMCM6805_002017 [Aspergillus fumigatiaffinis]